VVCWCWLLRQEDASDGAEDGDSAPQQAPLLVCGSVCWCNGVFGTMYIHVSLSSSQPVDFIGGGLLVSSFARHDAVGRALVQD